VKNAKEMINSLRKEQLATSELAFLSMLEEKINSGRELTTIQQEVLNEIYDSYVE